MGNLIVPTSLDPYDVSFYKAFHTTYGIPFLKAWADFRNTLALSGVVDPPEILGSRDLAWMPGGIAGDDKGLYWVDARSNRAMKMDAATLRSSVLFDADSSWAISDVRDADERTGRLLVSRAVYLPDGRARAETIVYDLASKRFLPGSSVADMREARFFRDGIVGIVSNLHNTDLVFVSKAGSKVLLPGSEEVIYLLPRGPRRVAPRPHRRGRRQKEHRHPGCRFGQTLPRETHGHGRGAPHLRPTALGLGRQNLFQLRLERRALQARRPRREGASGRNDRVFRRRALAARRRRQSRLPGPLLRRRQYLPLPRRRRIGRNAHDALQPRELRPGGPSRGARRGHRGDGIDGHRRPIPPIGLREPVQHVGPVSRHRHFRAQLSRLRPLLFPGPDGREHRPSGYGLRYGLSLRGYRPRMGQRRSSRGGYDEPGRQPRLRGLGSARTPELSHARRHIEAPGLSLPSRGAARPGRRRPGPRGRRERQPLCLGVFGLERDSLRSRRMGGAAPRRGRQHIAQASTS